MKETLTAEQWRGISPEQLQAEMQAREASFTYESEYKGKALNGAGRVYHVKQYIRVPGQPDLYMGFYREVR